MIRKILFLFTVSVISVFSVALLRPRIVTAATTQKAGNIVVQTGPTTTASEKVIERAKTSWPWYLTRASGLTAAVLMVILILSGIGMLTGYTYKFWEPLTAWATHRALGLAFTISALVHISSLLFDHFVPFNLAQILLPFMSSYRPLVLGGHNYGSVYVALGIISLYLTAGVVLSSLFWIDKKPRTWKFIHFCGYLTMTFVFIHALYLGTDLAHGIFKFLWIACGVSMAIAVIYRLKRAGTLL